MTARIGPSVATHALPIGIFDSGLGGLTVLRAVRALLPNESLLYLGDTARVPYGPRSAEAVTRYATQCANFLLTLGVKLIVVACNAATAHALTHLEQTCPVPVVGVIAPGAVEASLHPGTLRLGVIATAGTCASGAYPMALRAAKFAGSVHMAACPLFVPLIEEGFVAHPATQLITETYLAPLKQQNIDTLLLGCTHYPLLLPALRACLKDQVHIIDSAQATARHVDETLARMSRAAPPRAERAAIDFYATDLTERMGVIAKRFLGDAAAPFRAVDISSAKNMTST